MVGWGPLDFSLYSGGHVGFMGGLMELTNVEGILKIDCLKTDYYHREAYPTFLFFNPFRSEETVEITDLGDEFVDLYDTVSGQFAATRVKGKASFRLPGDSAAVIVIVPAYGKQERSNGQLWIEGVFVAPAPKPAVNIYGLLDRQKVSNVLKLNLEVSAPEGEQIEQITVTLGKTELFRGNKLSEPFWVDTDEFHNGLYHLRVVAKSSGGGRDSSEIGLKIENAANAISAPN
ncbi:hypothetical protein E5161_01190 [Cohnella pontilimi]|uniref:Uncharacterized protein n=1 Tax=Cohnella pontilimi TaxID=2564100 RepID=A0A4U0FKF6_9BACL|nr:hypothetical protein [Cohnella pontilimi]TJY44042.1 hypothetical protein E5161_01190 [Cohnella pontilimi]